jgi:hypothetical protein
VIGASHCEFRRHPAAPVQHLPPVPRSSYGRPINSHSARTFDARRPYDPTWTDNVLEAMQQLGEPPRPPAPERASLPGSIGATDLATDTRCRCPTAARANQGTSSRCVGMVRLHQFSAVPDPLLHPAKVARRDPLEGPSNTTAEIAGHERAPVIAVSCGRSVLLNEREEEIPPLLPRPPIQRWVEGPGDWAPVLLLGQPARRINAPGIIASELPRLAALPL